MQKNFPLFSSLLHSQRGITLPVAFQTHFHLHCFHSSFLRTSHLNIKGERKFSRVLMLCEKRQREQQEANHKKKKRREFLQEKSVENSASVLIGHSSQAFKNSNDNSERKSDRMKQEQVLGGNLENPRVSSYSTSSSLDDDSYVSKSLINKITDQITVKDFYEKHNQWRTHTINNPVWSLNAKNFQDRNVSWDILKQNRFQYHNIIELPDDDKMIKIELSEREIKIFDFLLQVNQHFQLNTVLRVAGGWVRNKILGLECDDIDIALDNMYGYEFAQKVAEYEKKLGMEVKSIGIIKANPDQSKHLDTATTHIFGEAIDFVNLRNETYANNSRIPTVQLGTPKEDAFRRDLTINSLFYNINSGKIEDFTMRGINDLRNGIVRTPLPALQTFIDDPLRILRSIRFASTYNFLIVDEIFDAAMNEGIKKALAEKVSRERIGIELSKTLKGPDPAGGLALISEMKLQDAIFTHSTETEKKKKKLREYSKPKALTWTDAQWSNTLFRTRQLAFLSKRYQCKGHDKLVLIFSAILSPIIPSSLSFEDKQLWCENLICISLKLPTKLSSDIASTIHHAQELSLAISQMRQEMAQCNMKQQLINYFVQKIQMDDQFRVVMGEWIRSANVPCFRFALLLASFIPTTGDEFTELDNIFINKTERITQCECLLEALHLTNFTSIVKMKSILNGKQVADILSINPGKMIGIVMNKLMRWQIQNYQHVTSETAIKWLCDNKTSLFNES